MVIIETRNSDESNPVISVETKVVIPRIELLAMHGENQLIIDVVQDAAKQLYKKIRTLAREARKHDTSAKV